MLIETHRFACQDGCLADCKVTEHNNFEPTSKKVAYVIYADKRKVRRCVRFEMRRDKFQKIFPL